MNLSPYDHCRCDQKQCRLGRTCNIIALLLTIILISGLAQAGVITPGTYKEERTEAASTQEYCPVIGVQHNVSRL